MNVMRTMVEREKGEEKASLTVVRMEDASEPARSKVADSVADRMEAASPLTMMLLFLCVQDEVVTGYNTPLNTRVSQRCVAAKSAAAASVAST
mmetsp:Transcript_1971/g.3792  ORF Transcript_1971/g.3792 Transcript_1971/m.3792 type:complete len:93 (-) Transcript_1971:759-1037(-)